MKALSKPNIMNSSSENILNISFNIYSIGVFVGSFYQLNAI